MRRDRLRLIQGATQKALEKARPLPSPIPQFAPLKHPSPQSSSDLTLALQASERRLNALLEDRGRIGQDLHDCVLQSLYAIGLNLKTSLRAPLRQTADTKQSGDRIVEQINHLIHEIRRMIRGLELGTVQAFDLTSELSALCAIYKQAGRLQLTMDLESAALEVLTKEEEQEILNIVREALSNCARHANATKVTVAIRIQGTRIRVGIHDNGLGFVAGAGRSRGYGLANMQARARKLGGTLRIESTEGRGTHVIAEFSVEPILEPV